MIFLLDWLQLASLAYAGALVINGVAAYESRPLPWAAWALLALLAGFYNRWLLRRPRSLLFIILVNLLPLGLYWAAVVAWQGGFNSWWADSLPGWLEGTAFYPLAAYLLCRPLGEREFPGAWEAGLLVLTLLGLWGEASSVGYPGLLIGGAVYLCGGLARFSLVLAHNASRPPGHEGFPVLPVVLVATGTTAGLGFLFANSAVGNLFTRALGAIWQGLRWLHYAILSLIALLERGRTRQPMDVPDWMKDLPWQSAKGLPTRIASVSRWFVVVLGVIVALLFLAALIYLGAYLYGLVRRLGQTQVSLPAPERRSLPRKSLWRVFFSALVRVVRHLWAFLGRCWRALFPIPPDSAASLYRFFLEWGWRNRAPRQAWETPNEYLDRLQSRAAGEPVWRDDLRAALVVLTDAFVRERFGGETAVLDQEKLWTTFGLLRRHRLPRPTQATTTLKEGGGS